MRDDAIISPTWAEKQRAGVGDGDRMRKLGSFLVCIVAWFFYFNVVNSLEY